MDYGKLKLELDSGAYKALIASGSDGGIVDALNAKTVSSQGTVPIADLKRYALTNGIYPKLVGGRTNTNQQIAGICISAIELLNDRDIPLDPSVPNVQLMLGALVQSGILAQADLDAILALGATKISRAEQVLGTGSVVSQSDISFVLRGDK